VSAVFALRRELPPGELAAYVLAQIMGGIAGVLIAHGMFDEALFEVSTKARSGPAQWLSEAVAAFGLVLTILLTLRANPAAVAASVGLFITAAYWFTASTSFANPAVTIARALSETFAGIRPADVIPFIVAQLAGAGAATLLSRWLVPPASAQS
jgi:glycerol uptake facilitator-like aquaporin